MKIYKLTHQRHIEYKLHTAEWITDNRLIGFFSTRDIAEQTKTELMEKPGFCDFPEAFTIDEYDVEGNSVKIWLVEHSYYIEDDRMDNVVEIGVYSSEEAAMAAAEEYEKTARFPVGTHSWDDDLDIDNYLSVAMFDLDCADFTDGFEIQ